MSSRAWPNVRVLRDVQRRTAVNETELLRRAFLYLARNTTLPQRVSVEVGYFFLGFANVDV
jgi:hypothetical protein